MQVLKMLLPFTLDILLHTMNTSYYLCQQSRGKKHL